VRGFSNRINLEIVIWNVMQVKGLVYIPLMVLVATRSISLMNIKPNVFHYSLEKARIAFSILPRGFQ